MRRTFWALCLLSLCTLTFAQHDHAAMPQQPAVLLDGVGNMHHPVSTKVPEAQKFFDQGLTLLYGFNHDEAARSFERAAELDPKLAIAWWGVAIVHGQNYNLPAMEDRQKAAYAALQKAQALAANATQAEQAYIAALSKRYVADPKADAAALEKEYSAAMKALMQQYPDDLDAATLYAESMMNQRPWALWTWDGKPAPGTEEILSVLGSVLRRNPQHIGANHYFIHAIEASPNPEAGLAAANRLAGLAPGLGHLVHMPSHIYLRTGDFDVAAQLNRKAADADRAYLKRTGGNPVYAGMYYSHNMHFEAVAHSMAGRYEPAMRAAHELEAHVGPMVAQMPMLESFMITSTLVMERFQKWSDILNLSAPPQGRSLQSIAWHYARGMAFASTGKADMAQMELAALTELRAKVPADAMMAVNPAQLVLTIPENILAGRIAEARKDVTTARARFEAAVETQDKLKYIEPPEWPTPTREMLGSFLLRQRRFADAEKVFRADLDTHPRNGRSLFGLLQALQGQKKVESASEVERQFKEVWATADTQLVADVGVEAAALQ